LSKQKLHSEIITDLSLTSTVEINA